MSKLEPNMYVRDRKGRVDKIIGFEGALIEFEKELMCGYIDCNNFTKASHNIIDLIEVGDYVEYKQSNMYWNIPTRVSGRYNRQQQLTELMVDDTPLKNVEITSIVTKEQFKLMEYVVKE